MAADAAQAARPPGRLFALAWAFVLASLGTRADDGDRQYEAPRAPACDKLAQVMQQSDKTDEKLRKYFELPRASAPRSGRGTRSSPRLRARRRAATEAEIFQALLHETGFATVELPQKLSAEHLLRALVDEIEDVPVPDLAARAEARRRDARAAARLLRARARAAARVCVCVCSTRRSPRRRRGGGTKKAKKPRTRGYTTGAKLAEAIGVAARVRDRFYFRARGRAAAAAAGARPGRGGGAAGRVPVLATAQALLRVRDQRSRLLKLLVLLGRLARVPRARGGDDGAGGGDRHAAGRVSAEVGADALLPEPEWRAAGARRPPTQAALPRAVVCAAACTRSASRAREYA